MGDKIENAAEVLGYIVLAILVALAALVVIAVLRWAGKIYNRWKYDSLQRANAELEWEQIRDSWIQKDRQDEDRNVFGTDFEDVPDPDRHDTLDLSDIPDQLYNYQEELHNEGR